MDVAPAGLLEDARRRQLALAILAARPEQHGAGRERGGEFLAVVSRRIAVEDLLERGAAQPGADQSRDAGGDRPARQHDDPGDGEGPEKFHLLGEPRGQPGMRLLLGVGEGAGGLERGVRGEHGKVARRETGGKQIVDGATEMRLIGERGDRLANDGKVPGLGHVLIPPDRDPVIASATKQSSTRGMDCFVASRLA